MKFVLLPSLEHMALVKIVVSLWNEKDVKALIVKFSSQPGFITTCYKWTAIEETLKEKALQLSLPQLLKGKMLGFIKPIGVQFFKWLKFHNTDFCLHLDLPAELCWTPQGTVNRKETAEAFVKDESLDISTRYKLACIYCLEDYIHKFWNCMPEDLKESDWDKFPIISFWSDTMKRREGCISYRSALHECAHLSSKAAAEYFLQKLTPSERGESLVETAKIVIDDEVLFFFLSKMNEEQRMEVFKNEPCKVLNCFLQWPLQNFFIQIANCMWDFLSKMEYNTILRSIIHKFTVNFKDWNYQKLFREFWQGSPNSLRRFITEEIDIMFLLPFLLRIKDKENIRLILKEVTFSAKAKLIYSDKMHTFLQRFISEDKWDFLELFIRECFPSKNEMLKFKKEFEKSIKWNFVEYNLMIYKYEWEQLFCLSDDSICKYDKRSAEGESSSSKRFRSLQ